MCINEMEALASHLPSVGFAHNLIFEPKQEACSPPEVQGEGAGYLEAPGITRLRSPPHRGRRRGEKRIGQSAPDFSTRSTVCLAAGAT